MRDPPSKNEPVPTVRALRERTVRDLGDLRHIGSVTATTLADASITAGDIKNQLVSFLKLVDLDVDPGVAARIRREYSLPWAIEPTRGARLRRRAGHIRHLRAEERSWIDESWETNATKSVSSEAATPDGGGSTTDAEYAWRERSGTGSNSFSPTDTKQTMSSTNTTYSRTKQARRSPRIDPSEHTVPELEEALESVDDPDMLVDVLQAERGEDDRKTAVNAIERRLRAVGIDPEEVPHEIRENAQQAPEERGAVDRRESDNPAVPVSGVEAVPNLSKTDVVSRLDAQLSESVDQIRRSMAEADISRQRFEVRLQAVDMDDWRLLSIALLLGLTSFSLLAVLVTALRPDLILPLGSLPLLLVTAIVGVMSIPLRWWEAIGGYHLTMLTGLLGLVSGGSVAAGIVGTSGTEPITLAIYTAIAVALTLTTYISSRERQVSG